MYREEKVISLEVCMNPELLQDTLEEQGLVCASQSTSLFYAIDIFFFVYQIKMDLIIFVSDTYCLFLNFFLLRCFMFADLPWYQQKIAATLFAAPPTSTYEEVTFSHYFT